MGRSTANKESFKDGPFVILLSEFDTNPVVVLSQKTDGGLDRTAGLLLKNAFYFLSLALLTNEIFETRLNVPDNYSVACLVHISNILIKCN